MNANELADELEQSALSTHRSLEVATMLRQQQAEIEALKRVMEDTLGWVQANDREKPFTGMDLCGEMVSVRLTGLCLLARAIGKRNDEELMQDWIRKAQEK